MRLSLGATRGAARSAAAHREPDARLRRRRTRHRRRLLGQAAAAAAGRISRRSLDWRVLAFVLASPRVTGIVFGIAPALRATGVNVNDAMKQSGRSVAGSRSVLEQIAARRSGGDLAGAAGRRGTVPADAAQPAPGGRRLQSRSNLLLFRINPQLNRYDEKRQIALYTSCSSASAAVPGVRGGRRCRNPALLSGSVNSTGIFVQGRVYEPGRRDYDNAINRLVTSTELLRDDGDPARCSGAASRRATTRPRRRSPSSTKRRRRNTSRTRIPIGQHFGSSIETSDQIEVVGVLTRREVQQRARSGAADDVRAVPADARGQRA